MTRIVLIGPLKPFRGGMSHSTTMLAENLNKNNELLVVSFSRLFPKLLYPGKFQKEKGKPPKGICSKFILDSINPVSWMKTVKEIKKFKPDTVIFEWWTTFLAPCYWFIAKSLKGTGITAVCHNIIQHEKKPVDSILSDAFLGKVDTFIAVSEKNLKTLKKYAKNKKAALLVEPTYDSIVCRKKISKANAKKSLGLKHKKVILFFGFVRKYKGLEYMLKAMPEILKKHNCLLLVVGEFWEPKKKYLEIIEELEINKNVKIVDKYIPGEKVPFYFKASDAIVLPYISGNASGIIKLAFGYNTPIITTKSGGSVELVADKKTGLLVKSKNSKELAKAVNKFYDKKLEAKIKKEMEKKLKEFEWSKEKENIVLGKF